MYNQSKLENVKIIILTQTFCLLLKYSNRIIECCKRNCITIINKSQSGGCYFDNLEIMSTALDHASAAKRLDALFAEPKSEVVPAPKPKPITIPEIHVEVDSKTNAKCEVHGKKWLRRSP